MRSATFVTTRLLFVVMAVIALAAAAVLATTFRAEAASFSPAGSACLDNADTVDPDPFNTGSPNECDGNNAPGAASAITTTFGVPKGDSNFGGVVAFTPPEWGVPEDSDIPDGTLVAQLKSKAVLGLLNSSCSTALDVEFNLMDATTDQADTVLFNEPNKPASDTAEQFQVVGGLPRGVTEYPDYLSRILWGTAENSPLQLRARLYGQTNVSGVWVSLNFAIFEPGTTIRGDTPDPAIGFPSVTILNNGGDPDIAPAPSAITDFCSPLSTSTTTFATGGGVDLRTNPDKDGTYNFVVWTRDQRDADNDGFENSLDTCPFDANPNWDPRAEAPPGSPFPGDSDRDGIPDDCDPLPDAAGNPGTGNDDAGAINDHDGDNYYNRQDNCPFVRNNLGIAYFIQGGTGNQTDADLDGIGDDCDPNKDTPDGEQVTRCVITEITIGTGGEAPPKDYFPCGTRCSTDVCNLPTPAPGSPTPTLPPGATPRPTGGVPGPSTGVGSLAPADGHLPLWAVGLVGVAWLGIMTGGFVFVRSKRE